ncbi:MAG: serine/threonine-protein kinase [bacterium]|nr:serine/threonine-protein kinase [bacterium]
MASELNGKLIAEKYRVDEFICESSFGTLYRGSNILLDKPVAIGILGVSDEEFLARAKAAAKVSHPNLLNLNDLGTDADGSAYAIYESAPGEPLTDAFGREGQLPVDMAIDVARQIGAGLSAAHAAGLVHGDLSPSSVVVSSSEPGRVSVKVFGFGSPNALHDGSADPARFAYLAPEQCSGAEHADNRGDIYSLGVILYQALAASPPFAGDSASDVMMRQMEEPPPPLSSFRADLPAWIEPVILQAMAKNPDARYQSVDTFVADLANASAVPTAVPVDSAGANNNLWKTAFVVLAGISLLTIGLIYMTYSRQTDPTTALQPDANGMPVQPINPATGVEEQNLSSLPPEFSYDANTNTMVPTTGAVPGDAGNPWLNGNTPPGGAPLAPGGQVIQVPLAGSPFMNDPNCIPQPSGIMLCTVPVTPTPSPRVSPTARTPANANTNTGTTPTGSPTPVRTTPTPRPANTPARPAGTPTPNRPDPNGEGGNGGSEFKL